MSSSLTRFFGSSRKSTSPRGSTSDDKTVISELQDSKELMDKRIEHLERKAEMEVEAALAHQKAGAKGKVRKFLTKPLRRAHKLLDILL